MTPTAAKAQVDTAHKRYAEPARYQFAIASRHEMTVKLALIAGALTVIIARPEQTTVALWGAGAALALMEIKSLTVTLKGKAPRTGGTFQRPLPNAPPPPPPLKDKGPGSK